MMTRLQLSTLVLVAIGLTLTSFPLCDAACDSAPAGTRVCSIQHLVPPSSDDSFGDSSVYNTLSTNPSTSQGCAQAYADYLCSKDYPVCTSTLSETTVCQSLCQNFASQCQGQLSSVPRDDCTGLPSSGCTSNTGSDITFFYPPKQGLTPGDIAGIVIGVVVGVVIIVIIIIIVLRRQGGGGGGSGGGTARAEPGPTRTPKNDRGKAVEARRSVAEETPTVSIGVAGGGGAEEEMKPVARKARAPSTASPRASLNLPPGDGAARKSGLNDKDAKIKSQLEALGEGQKKPPPPWGIYYTDDGDLYYWNSETDESTWEFPVVE